MRPLSTLLVVPLCLATPWALAVALPAQHPQAVTDCGNCHDDPWYGYPELHWVHQFNCNWCHPDYEFTRTILGPVGTWNRQCSHCHNPAVAETRNLPEPTKGHRCVVCHGQQMPTTDPQEFHRSHAERVNCAVCHGFVPDVGTAIGSGNRAVCTVCHDSTVQGTGLRDFHRRMSAHGVSCLECHGGVRPPVDVLPGSPVGNAAVVCDLCHQGADPLVFRTRGPELHRRHTSQRLDCGSCHLDANLQDDHWPMAALDDPRRGMLPRAGYGECAHCHAGGASGSIRQVHDRHVGSGRAWCFTCHPGGDQRPIGQAPPVQRPDQSCQLCHGSGRAYGDDFPFRVHMDHAAGQKCYSCHQGSPPVFDWPEGWQRQPGTFTTYGNGCPGSNQAVPAIGHVGLPLLGRSFDVTVSQAPANAPTLLAVGIESLVLPLDLDGMPGCSLYLRPLGTLFLLTGAEGAASFRQGVPSQRAFIGMSFYFQWWMVDPPANARGLISSAGGRATVGR